MDNPAEYLQSFHMFDYIGGRFSATSMGPLYEALCSGVHPFSALALMSALSASGLSAIPVHKSRALCAPAPRLLLQLQRLAGIERKDAST